MKSIIFLGLAAFVIAAFVPAAFADECKTGQTRFNWKKMQEETCPPNGSWDICKTIKFPENDKTNGNKVCKSLGLGKCRGVNREQVTVQGVKDFLKYDCSEELHFSATDNQRYCWTIPFQVQGWPTEKCLDQKTEVICCN